MGASGLVGRAAVARFLADGDGPGAFDVVAVSRRELGFDDESHLRHLPLDLRDGRAVAAAIHELPPVSHLVYAAAHERPGLVAGWSDPQQMATNRSMLDNVLTPLAARGDLRHVTLMQGTKAYGVHLHPIRLPARERHPRDEHPNFYWLQEDLLRERAASAGFGWTILRPVQVVGPAYGVAYCTPPVIGAFAAICHEEGLPFGFPGGTIAPAKQAVDVRLVADAIRWAVDSPAAIGEHFNLTNGEVFGWTEIWPVLAEVMGVEPADPKPLRLSDFLEDRAATWSRVVARHHLRRLNLAQLLGQSHLYADYTFGVDVTVLPPPALVSSVKIKQAGFGAVYDTEVTFTYALESLIRQRILPDLRK